MSFETYTMKHESKGLPLISVIVPIYNKENLMRKCLDSIQAQTFQNYECLLIDDGSTDGSSAICDEYAIKDSRFKAFHKENGGVSSARQFGIDHAYGEYTIHADPDDWVEPTMLEDLYKKAKDEDADMVICDYFVNTYKGQQYMCQKPTSMHHDVVLRELFGRIHGSCCNKLIKRSCYEEYGIEFPHDLSFCEDEYVMASLLKENIRVEYLSNAYYHYFRDNPSSLSRRYTKKTYEEDLRARDMYYDLLGGTGIQREVYNIKSYSILCRAFYGGKNLFSSKEFRYNFSEYKPIIKSSISPIIEKIFIYMSCDGLYQFSIRVFSCMIRVNRFLTHFYSR